MADFNDITGKFGPEMDETCRNMASKGRGLLAADESTGTIGKRFAQIDVENIEENRRAYRELLFTSEGFGDYISGVILFEETLYQKTKDGVPFVDLMKKAGVVPGIKLDKGPVALPGTDGETYTQGFDKLDDRCAEYYRAGARFAKWRAVYKITETCPTPLAVLRNANDLALYAAICQRNGLVPIVEPEILMDGDHDIARSAQVTQDVLSAVFKALNDHHVNFHRMILKPNMVIAGYGHAKATPEQVADATVRVLLRTVPACVPAIMFLSGGQSELDSTENLNAMNKLPENMRPWNVSYSYGRALQQSCLKTWVGKAENIAAAQQAFLKRARMNYNAEHGKWDRSEE